MPAYDVFFSYRHKPFDQEIVRRCFRFAEGYRFPASLTAKGYGNIRRCFQDTEETELAKMLADSIEIALEATKCLVVVCSEDTPASPWVNQEVERFAELGREEHIYVLLISGEAQSSCPPALLAIPGYERRLLDVRAGRNVRKTMAKAKTELLRVIADAVGCREEDLQREDALRSSRVFGRRALFLAGAFALTAGFTAVMLGRARAYREEAKRMETASLTAISTLTYELPDRLSGLPGTFPQIAGILEDNTEDLNRILLLSQDRSAAEYTAAANYERLATAQSTMGRMEEALEAQEKALALYEKASPEDLASGLNNKGTLLYLQGRYDEARGCFLAALGTLETLEESSAEEEALKGKIWYNAGSCSAYLGDSGEAFAYFEKSLEIFAGKKEYAEVEAGLRYNKGGLFLREGRGDAALEELSLSAQLYRQLLEESPSLALKNACVKALSLAGACASSGGDSHLAQEYYQEALVYAEDLEQDAENLEYQRTAASLYNNLGVEENARGNFAQAGEWFEKASLRYQRIFEKSGGEPEKADVAFALLNQGENAFKAGEWEEAENLFPEGLDLLEEAAGQLGTYYAGLYKAWESYYELVLGKDAQAALQAAYEGYQLLPGEPLVMLNLAYACIYTGRTETAEELLQYLLVHGGMSRETILQDAAAQERAGMNASVLKEVMERIGGQE